MLREVDDWGRTASAIYLRAAARLAADEQRRPPAEFHLAPTSLCAELRLEVVCCIESVPGMRERLAIRVAPEGRARSALHLLSVIADPDGVELHVDGWSLTQWQHTSAHVARGDALKLPRGVFLVAEADTPRLARIVVDSRCAEGQRRLAQSNELAPRGRFKER